MGRPQFLILLDGPQKFVGLGIAYGQSREQVGKNCEKTWESRGFVEVGNDSCSIPTAKEKQVSVQLLWPHALYPHS